MIFIFLEELKEKRLEVTRNKIHSLALSHEFANGGWHGDKMDMHSFG